MSRKTGKYQEPLTRLLVQLCCFLFLFCACPSQLCSASQSLKIGVLAKRGPELALSKWSPTADYLTSSLSGYHFEIIPLDFTEIHAAVRDGRVDFVLANSAFYVELEKLYGVSRIATLVNQHLIGQQTTTFGGVIFCRKDRTEIRDLTDFPGHSFMAVEQRSFGGWIMALREMHRLDIEAADFSSLQYGMTHDAVVYAVRDGRVDCGTVRSDTLERMALDGKISLADFHIFNSRKHQGFPFLLSTDLYPEWPMAALEITPNKVARLVAAALMAMPVNHAAAQASKTAGWTIPLNYQPVHDCLLELRLGPYEDYGTFTLADALIRYWRHALLVGLALFGAISLTVYILHLNRKLQLKKTEVDELNMSLEGKVRLRTSKINNLLDQEMYLREILQTVAEVNELMVTSSNLEMLLQDACATFAEHGHYGFSWIGLLEGGRFEKIYTSDTAIQFLAEPPYILDNPTDLFFTSPAARCVAKNSVVIIEPSEERPDTTPWRNQGGMVGFQAVIGLPLRSDQYNDPFGALCVYTWRKEGFDPEEVAMLEELAGDIGFAIDSFHQKDAVADLQRQRTANYEETILSFVNMIDHRDTYTAGHTQRVARYSRMIAREMGYGKEDILLLQKAAILHDVGKVATPDSVLLKPGKLSGQDYDLIKLHACAGYDMLSQIKMYKELAVLVRHHHERHDGRGYPDGLKGDKIPPLSRIITVADAFDAMTTNRIYKARKKVADAIAELVELSGKQFNPEVVLAAVKVLRDVKVETTITQLPKTKLEKRRFSYFFNDNLTGLYNEHYLQVVLHNNLDLHEYSCFNNLHLLNLPDYNKRAGWQKGNLLLQNFADELKVCYPDTLLFRAYGNDFVVIAREHFTIDTLFFDFFSSIKGTEVEVDVDHIDLMQDKIYTINKLEKLEIQVMED